MYRITDIGRAGALFAVRITRPDGDGVTCLVAKEFFMPLGLSEGDEIGEDALEDLLRAAGRTEAVTKALDVLSRSDVSRKALTDKLRFKYKIDAESAEFAADYAVERRYLDEDSSARRAAERCVRQKKWGRRRVVADLISKGYPREVAAGAARSVSDEDYRAALNELIKHRFSAAPKDPASVRRAVSALIRLGHEADDVKAALGEVFSDEDK